MVDAAEVHTRQPRVAYFSMEIALRSEIPTYAGGLGVLAGDTLRSAACGYERGSTSSKGT